MNEWVSVLNSTVLAKHRTRLVGGFDEPVYLPATERNFAEIRFTRDYERSALHELAHWTVAGARRRQLEDYGYWYAPDGRNELQQAAFFRMEIRPQAIEKCFCIALGRPFDVSADNLNGEVSGLQTFRSDVDRQARRFLCRGLPARAKEICLELEEFRSSDSEAEVI